MNRDLELLLLALDALLQAGPDEAHHLEAAFEECLGETLTRYPGFSRDQLLRSLHAYYPRWVAAQKRPPSAAESLIVFRRLPLYMPGTMLVTTAVLDLQVSPRRG